ncbi:hypothetical protein BJ165DRAFT_236195 [Panaeolus papilionaceus]|nr:hypothetical protein BJ165DRAFT_236195 [Panaeolus papilionaceus]
MRISLPPGHNLAHMSTPCVDIRHFPTNYSDLLVGEQEQIRLYLGPGITPRDMACIKAMAHNDAYIGGKQRLEIVCDSLSYTFDLTGHLDHCIPKDLPFVFLRVTDRHSLTEGVLVRNGDKGLNWASSFTSHIDTFNLVTLLSLTNLEIVDLRPPFNPRAFDATVLQNAVRKLHIFFDSLPFSKVKRLVLPMDLILKLPELMHIAGRSSTLETLELYTNHSQLDASILQAEDTIIRTISHMPHLQEIIYPLEWATADLLRHFALQPTLSCIRLKSLIHDPTGRESAQLSQSLFGLAGVNWQVVCIFQRWFFPSFRT